MPAAAAVSAEIGRRAPRVHVVTNTVAQAITANALLAIGADASMSTHPAETGTLMASADALLVNLGTPDGERGRLIERLLGEEAAPAPDRRVVLDPVMVHLSPLRLDWAVRLVARYRPLVRGNAREMAALAAAVPPDLWAGLTRVTTGAVDVVERAGRRQESPGGHPLMRQVTGLGCATSALIAAALAVEPDSAAAAGAMLALSGEAARRAAARASGPGSFAVAWIDELAAEGGAP
jgi:hydroxyethylthiazole kinase